MKRLLACCAACGVLWGTVAFAVASASAALKSDESRADAEAVDEALRCEIRGADAERGKLLKSVLKLMLDTRGLTMMYKDGVLLVVPKDRIYREVKTQIYDVRDMLLKIQDFPGPKVELTAPGDSSAPLAGATFTLDEPTSTITEDFLVEVIRQNTGGDSWDENENASITLINGMLIVTQSTKVHREIWRVLQLLRQFQ